uniref:Uncharacterized protein n=1 Tax=Panagrolaimus sp. PS1159 TaxID=55785 RepID=A0AC35G5C3_9BILA
TNAQDDVKKLLFEHFYELVIDNQRDNLAKVRNSSLLNRLLMLLFEEPSVFVIRNDILFRLIGAIVQPPCDSHSLLRFGQTLSANLSAQTPQEIHENEYPFHIAELEKLLLAQCNGNPNPVINEELYSVYVRNRLLNMLGNMLAHSSGQINSQLCESIVSTLGFGWILAMCAPGLHPGTVYLGLKILVNVTKHPSILSKFRDGACNGGWLTDADSVIRNRAAVLLGFSVSAHGGAVGSHVDFNPELSNCNGFAALEYLMYMHADQPFCYLAMLALLFGQHQANIQPLEEFNVDLIWSNVFSLNATSSVSDAIAKCTFCPEALIPLFSMIRAGLHYPQSDNISQDHWSQSYPIMVLQLTTFLYQNSETFFGISHTSTFVVTLFTTLLPRPNIGLYGESGKETSPSALPTHRAIKLVMELLTNILLNDLCLSHELRTECIFDMLVEFLEGGGVMHPSQSTIYTELVNSCLDHFMTSDMFFSNSALIIPKSAEGLLNRSSESTAVNVVHFLSKVIDSVWDCLYRGNPVAILK